MTERDETPDAERLAEIRAWYSLPDNAVGEVGDRAFLLRLLDAATSRPDRPTMHDPNECPWCRKRLDAASGTSEAFQQRVDAWIQACFGAEIGADRIERNHRFFEEATEAVQANGMTRSECRQLVDYTFDRPVGELRQEVGGVLNTLAALCTASGVDMDQAGEVELRRVWGKVETIRAKQKTKPKHSPLPEGAPEPSEDTAERLYRAIHGLDITDPERRAEHFMAAHLDGYVSPNARGMAKLALIEQFKELRAAPEPSEERVEAAIAEAVQIVSEFTDRTSPEDNPDMLLITPDELAKLLWDFAEALPSLEVLK